MNKCVYRNFYWIKETIIDFFIINKKRLFLSLIAIVLGATIGLCIAIKNSDSFTFINCSDKIILNFFCDGKAFVFFIKKILLCLLIVISILIINNFSFLTFLNYVLFGYLSFRLSVNCVIFCFNLGLTGILFVLTCYLLINILIILMYIILFLICKTSAESCGNSGKIANYPYKAILLLCGIIVLLCLLMTILILFFSKFMTIII